MLALDEYFCVYFLFPHLKLDFSYICLVSTLDVKFFLFSFIISLWFLSLVTVFLLFCAFIWRLRWTWALCIYTRVLWIFLISWVINFTTRSLSYQGLCHFVGFVLLLFLCKLFLKYYCWFMFFKHSSFNFFKFNKQVII